MQFLKRLNLIFQSKLFYIVLILLLIIYIIINISIKRTSKYSVHDTKLNGKVISYKIDGDKLSITLEAKEKVIANYYFKNEQEKEYYQNNLKINTIVLLNGTFKVPLENSIPNTFNYKKYLYNNKIYMLFDIESIEFLKEGKSIKNLFIKRLNKFERKDYLYAFILGDKSNLDMTDFQSNGVSHLFAISGMHVSFLVSFLEKRLKIKKKTIINLLLWAYAFLVSFSVGVLRVVIFKTLKELLNKLKIQIENFKILLLTAIIMLLINPFYIYNYGFLYSFIITLSIMFFKIKGNYFYSLVKISIISFGVSIPITISLNYQINILTIFNNLIFVPLVSFIIFPLTLITFILPFIEPLLNYFIQILDFINHNLPALNIIFPKMNLVIYLLYYSFFLLYVKSKNNLIFMALLLILGISKFNYLLENDIKIYFLDVGQGDSSFIFFPKHSEVIIIDTGGKFIYEKELWQKQIKNYLLSDNIKLFLNSLGISKLDKLILTHGDYDHMGEVINLVENFKVEKVIFNCGEFNELELDLIKVLDKKKIPYYSCIKELNVDNQKLYFLNNKNYGNENDNSSVIYTKLNNHKFLFMGDAGVEVEEDLIEKYNLQDIDVLKVGHHGSKTSSSKNFIDKINPKYSIISVGKNNRYGHPNDNVLNNLVDSQIYRTDQDGSIMFKIRNDKLKIETCAP